MTHWVHWSNVSTFSLLIRTHTGWALWECRASVNSPSQHARSRCQSTHLFVNTEGSLWYSVHRSYDVAMAALHPWWDDWPEPQEHPLPGNWNYQSGTNILILSYAMAPKLPCQCSKDTRVSKKYCREFWNHTKCRTNSYVASTLLSNTGLIVTLSGDKTLMSIVTPLLDLNVSVAGELGWWHHPVSTVA